jgi:dTDP-4-amino-4,6-dideoxygalactose transaminase
VRHTEDCSRRLIRLPLWNGLGSENVGRVVDAFAATVASRA